MRRPPDHLRVVDEPPPDDPDDPGPDDDDTEDDWRRELLRTKAGAIKLAISNITHTIRNHFLLRERLGYDTRRLQPVWLEAPPWGPESRDITDADAVELAMFLHLDMRVGYSSGTCAEALIAEAHQRPIDRVVDYLSDLTWDGRVRLETWITDYLGAEMNGYVAVVGRAWPISAVARALKPGCKADSMLVLEGPQGVGKSSALMALAGEDFFSELSIDVGDKDSWLAIHGPWIVEWSELAGFGRREAEAIKSFLSRQVDRMRPPYGRVTSDYPRRVIFTGSTNESTYLGDPTGGRRYWPIRVGVIDVEGLAEARDQVWAEAVVAYQGGEPWWLRGVADRAACAEQDRRLEVDPWESLVVDYLESPGVIAREYVRAIAVVESLGITGGSVTAVHSRRVGRILDRLRWTRGEEQIGGKGRPVRVFYRPAREERNPYA